MAEILKPAGISGVPATEDYGRTLRALQLVPEEELRQLPPRLQEALLEVDARWRRCFAEAWYFNEVGRCGFLP